MAETLATYEVSAVSGQKKRPLHERAAEARASGDTEALTALQAEVDARYFSPRKPGEGRRIMVDVTKDPDASPVFSEEYLADVGRDRKAAKLMEALAQAVRQDGLYAMAREVIETPRGTMGIEHTALTSGVELDAVYTDSGNMAEMATITEEGHGDEDSGRSHTIEVTRRVDEGPEEHLTIDGHDPTDEEAETAMRVLTHLHESLAIAIDQAPAAEVSIEEPEGVSAPNYEAGSPEPETEELMPETMESDPSTPAPEKTAVPSELDRYRRHSTQFFQEMVRYPGTQQTMLASLQAMGVDNGVFEAAVNSGSGVNRSLLEDMQTLYNQYPPNSSIWQESENSLSLAGRAAKDAKTKLCAIIERTVQ